MKESTLERYFRRAVNKAGGVAEKFTSPNKRNVPDQLVTWAGPWMDFVELKREGEKPRKGQLRDHDRRRKMGFRVFVIDTRMKVDAYISMRTNPRPDFEVMRRAA